MDLTKLPDDPLAGLADDPAAPKKGLLALPDDPLAGLPDDPAAQGLSKGQGGPNVPRASMDSRQIPPPQPGLRQVPEMTAYEPTFGDRVNQGMRSLLEGTLLSSEEEAQGIRQAEAARVRAAGEMGVSQAEFRDPSGATLPAGRIVAGAARGIVRPLAGATRFVERKTGINTGMGKKLKAGAEMLTPQDPTVADTSVENFTSTLGLLIPGLGTQKAIGAIQKIPALAKLPGLMQAAGKWGGAVTMAAPEAAAEAEDVYDQLIAQGKSPEEASATADKVFWSNAAILAITDRIGWFDKGGRLRKMGAEAIQEGSQRGISNVATDRPVLEGVPEAAVSGAAVAGGIDVLGGMAKGLLQTRRMRAGGAVDQGPALPGQPLVREGVVQNGVQAQTEGKAGETQPVVQQLPQQGGVPVQQQAPLSQGLAEEIATQVQALRQDLAAGKDVAEELADAEAMLQHYAPTHPAPMKQESSLPAEDQPHPMLPVFKVVDEDGNTRYFRQRAYWSQDGWTVLPDAWLETDASGKATDGAGIDTGKLVETGTDPAKALEYMLEPVSGKVEGIAGQYGGYTVAQKREARAKGAQPAPTLEALPEDPAQAEPVPGDRRQQAAPVPTDQRQGERRNEDVRAALDQELERDLGTMTREELIAHAERLRQENGTDSLTGIPNAAAWARMRRTNPKPVVIAFDGNELGGINNLGHDIGDAAIKLWAEGMQLAQQEIPDLDIARGTQGDELFGQLMDTEQAEKAVQIIERHLTENPILFTRGGKEYELTVGLSSGIGSTIKEADTRLGEDKDRRAREGLRNPVKGGVPVGLSERGQAGQRDDQGREVSGEPGQVAKPKKNPRIEQMERRKGRLRDKTHHLDDDHGAGRGAEVVPSERLKAIVRGEKNLMSPVPTTLKRKPASKPVTHPIQDEATRFEPETPVAMSELRPSAAATIQVQAETYGQPLSNGWIFFAQTDHHIKLVSPDFKTVVFGPLLKAGMPKSEELGARAKMMVWGDDNPITGVQPTKPQEQAPKSQESKPTVKAPTPPKSPEGPESKNPKGETADRYEMARDMYQPGNIVFNGYWRKYDRVVEFRPRTETSDWSVIVEEVKKDGGSWKTVGDQRFHRTLPEKGDKVVERAKPQGATTTGKNPNIQKMEAKGKAEAARAKSTAAFNKLMKIVGDPGTARSVVDKEAFDAAVELVVSLSEEGVIRFKEVVDRVAEMAGGAVPQSIKRYLERAWDALAGMDSSVEARNGATVESITAAPEKAPGSDQELRTLLLDELASGVREDMGGLIFIPDVVRKAKEAGFEVARAQQMLKDLVREGSLELRPESGMNRMTPEELSLAPDGFQGTRLTWGRLLTNKGTQETSAGIPGADKAGLSVVKNWHSVNKHDIWVVKIANKVDRPIYDALNSLAKTLGGYYSKYKGNGAIPGFVFNTEAEANAFLAKAVGKEADNGRSGEGSGVLPDAAGPGTPSDAPAQGGAGGSVGVGQPSGNGIQAGSKPSGSGRGGSGNGVLPNVDSGRGGRSPVGAEETDGSRDLANHVGDGGTDASGTVRGLDTGLNYDVRSGGLSPENLSSEGGKKRAAQNNVDAIRIAKTLKAEARQATPEEQRALAKFVGWGALDKAVDAWRARQAERLDEDKKDDAQKKWEKDWLPIYKQLVAVLSPAEMRQARTSIRNAHYTSQEVISGVWSILEGMGVAKGNALEPSAGIGNFIGLAPQGLNWGAVELDGITSEILAGLYPQAAVASTGFQNIVPHAQQDLVISNFPFDNNVKLDYRGERFSLHDFFFLQGLEHLRPGGVLVGITSHYTLDKLNPRVRELLAGQAEFLGAVRLPNDAFSKNAGTQVVTDVIFLQKKGPGVVARTEPWGRTKPVKVTNRKGEEIEVEVNEYFHTHKGMVLGTFGAGGLENMDQLTVHPFEGQGTLESQIQASAKGLPKDVTPAGYTPGTTALALDVRPGLQDAAFAGQKGTKPGSVVFENGKVGVRLPDGTVSPLVIGKNKKGDILLETLTKEQARDLENYQAVRDIYAELILMEKQDVPDEDLADLRQKLNEAYDKLVAPRPWGTGKNPITAPAQLTRTMKNLSHPFRWLKNDVDYFAVASLEVGKDGAITKAPIFSQRVIRPAVEPSDFSLADAAAAYSASLAWRGHVDLDWMAQKTGMSPSNLEETLAKERIAFRDPSTGEIVPGHLYLSGNVRKKLKLAESMGLEENALALKAVQPEPRVWGEFNVSVLSPWVPDSLVSKFLRNRLRVDGLEPFLDSFGKRTFNYLSKDELGRRRIYSPRTSSREFEVDGEYGGHRVSIKFNKILENTFNGNKIVVKIYDEEGHPIGVNMEATEFVQARQKALEDAFNEWTNEEAGALEAAYNENVNHSRTTEWPVPVIDRYPGASLAIMLEDFQKRFVERTLESNALGAHVVGTGKTFSMVTSAMEAKRRGLARKPVITTLNQAVGTVVSQAKALYPGATIMYLPDNPTAEQRRIFAHQVRTRDVDLVVMPMSAFDMIGDSKAAVESLILQMEEELEDTLRNIQDKQAKKRTQKRAQAAIDKLRDTLLEQSKRAVDKGMPIWDDFGFDWLLVDEAHAFKKLGFTTTKQGIRGIDTGRSQRAFSLYVKSRAVNAAQGFNRGVVFATGTPVSNTMAELWTIGRFLDPEGLEDFGIKTFDEFVGVFSSIETRDIYTATQEYKTYDMLGKFRNGPEFMTWFSRFADRVGADQIKRSSLPKMIGGKREVIEVEPTPQTQAIVNELADRLKDWYDLPPKERAKNGAVPMVIEGLAVNAAIDPRLVNPTLPFESGTKLAVAIEETFKIWSDPTLTQDKAVTALFLDRYRSPDPESSAEGAQYRGVPRFNAHHEIRDRLVDLGVPREQIYLLTDGTDAENRAAQDKINAGEIRIVIGTTEKGGTGVNIQQRLYALGHIDLPYNAAGITQREGRQIRSGNMFTHVRTMAFGTKKTLDAKKAESIFHKVKFFDQFMFSKDVMAPQEFEDISTEDSLSYNDMVGCFSGDPRVMRKSVLERELKDLERQRRGHMMVLSKAKAQYALLGAKLEADGARVERFRASAQAAAPVLEAVKKIQEANAEYMAKLKEAVQAKTEKPVFDGPTDPNMDTRTAEAKAFHKKATEALPNPWEATAIWGRDEDGYGAATTKAFPIVPQPLGEGFTLQGETVYTREKNTTGHDIIRTALEWVVRNEAGEIVLSGMTNWNNWQPVLHSVSVDAATTVQAPARMEREMAEDQKTFTALGRTLEHPEFKGQAELDAKADEYRALMDDLLGNGILKADGDEISHGIVTDDSEAPESGREDDAEAGFSRPGVMGTIALTGIGTVLVAGITGMPLVAAAAAIGIPVTVAIGYMVHRGIAGPRNFPNFVSKVKKELNPRAFSDRVPKLKQDWQDAKELVEDEAQALIEQAASEVSVDPGDVLPKDPKQLTKWMEFVWKPWRIAQRFPILKPVLDLAVRMGVRTEEIKHDFIDFLDSLKAVSPDRRAAITRAWNAGTRERWEEEVMHQDPETGEVSVELVQHEGKVYDDQTLMDEWGLTKGEIALYHQGLEAGKKLAQLQITDHRERVDRLIEKLFKMLNALSTETGMDTEGVVKKLASLEAAHKLALKQGDTILADDLHLQVWALKESGAKDILALRKWVFKQVKQLKLRHVALVDTLTRNEAYAPLHRSGDQEAVVQDPKTKEVLYIMAQTRWKSSLRRALQGRFENPSEASINLAIQGAAREYGVTLRKELIHKGTKYRMDPKLAAQTSPLDPARMANLIDSVTTDPDLLGLLDHEEATNLAELLKAAAQTSRVKNYLKENRLKHHLLERKGTYGESLDGLAAWSSYIQAAAQAIASNESMDSLNEAVGAIDKETDPKLRAYAENLRAQMISPDLMSPAVQNAIAVTALWTIGGKLSFAVQNASQVMVETMRLINRFGYAQAIKATVQAQILSARIQVMQGLQKLGVALGAESLANIDPFDQIKDAKLRKITRDAFTSGIFMDRVGDRISRYAEGRAGGAVAATGRGAKTVLMAPASLSEQNNRIRAFIGYALASLDQDAATPFGELTKAAEDHVRHVHFERSSWNKSKLERSMGGLGSALTMFQYYLHEFIQESGNAFRVALHGEEGAYQHGTVRTAAEMLGGMTLPGTKMWQAAKGLRSMSVMMFALAGMTGFKLLFGLYDIMKDFLEGLYRWLFDQPYDPTKDVPTLQVLAKQTYRMAKAQGLTDEQARMVHDVVMHGATNALGVDMSGSISPGVYVMPDMVQNPGAKGADFIVAFGGVPGSTAAKLIDAWVMWEKGEKDKALRLALPAFAKHWQDAYTGRANLGGRTMNLTPGQRVVKATGFTPTPMAREYWAKDVTMQAQSNLAQVKADLGVGFLRAFRAKFRATTPEETAAAQKQLDEARDAMKAHNLRMRALKESGNTDALQYMVNPVEFIQKAIKEGQLQENPARGVPATMRKSLKETRERLIGDEAEP